eukprot:TRINITY_DN16251_c2_g1_i1.p1 TRINITY_DN16251_c2_g1~~TRINITY_DN16251_c2_g1_i1.p1  ORF type:complete len:588 (+),score=139.95 TRINITY_DN16251_c2_g1_i1:150-1766(+)
MVPSSPAATDWVAGPAPAASYRAPAEAASNAPVPAPAAPPPPAPADGPPRPECGGELPPNRTPWEPVALLPRLPCAAAPEPKRRLYYAVAFGGEAELLLVHLHEIAPVADVIVVVEFGLTHSMQPKQPVFRALSAPGGPLAPFAERVRYLWYDAHAVAGALKACAHVPSPLTVPGCEKREGDRWSMVHLMYRVTAAGLWDAADGDVVVLNADCDEVVHRRSLLAWRHCPIPGAPRRHLPLRFLNLWYTFNCAERPHREMARSVWVWRRDYWPKLWQWFTGTGKHSAAAARWPWEPRPLRTLTGPLGLPPAAAPRLDDLYDPVHACVCARGLAGNASAAACPPCAVARERVRRAQQRMRHTGQLSSEDAALVQQHRAGKIPAVAVPAAGFSLSHNRDFRSAFVPPAAGAAPSWEEAAAVLPLRAGAGEWDGGGGGWHLSYFGGAGAVARHNLHKAHRKSVRISGEAAARAATRCENMWESGAIKVRGRPGRMRRELAPLPPGDGGADTLPWLVAANREWYRCRGWFADYAPPAAAAAAA